MSWNFRQYIKVAECYLAYFYAHGLQMSSVWLYGKNTSFYGNGYYGTRHCGIGVGVALRLYNAVVQPALKCKRSTNRLAQHVA